MIDLDEVLGGALVDLAAAPPRVDEGAESDPGEQSGLAGRGVPEQLREGALRQVVCPDLVVRGQLSQCGGDSPESADTTGEQAGVAQPVEPAALPVSGGNGEHQGEISRGSGIQESLLQREGQFLGKTLTHKSLDHQVVTVADQPDGIRGADDLVPHPRAGRRVWGDEHEFPPVPSIGLSDAPVGGSPRCDPRVPQVAPGDPPAD